MAVEREDFSVLLDPSQQPIKQEYITQALTDEAFPQRFSQKIDSIDIVIATRGDRLLSLLTEQSSIFFNDLYFNTPHNNPGLTNAYTAGTLFLIHLRNIQYKAQERTVPRFRKENTATCIADQFNVDQNLDNPAVDQLAQSFHEYAGGISDDKTFINVYQQLRTALEKPFLEKTKQHMIEFWQTEPYVANMTQSPEFRINPYYLRRAFFLGMVNTNSLYKSNQEMNWMRNLLGSFEY